MGCINRLAEAIQLIKSVSQTSALEKAMNHNLSLFDFSDEFAVCHAMMHDFEKDGISQSFMIDLVGEYLDGIVAHNDRCQV
jgi:hypothetical protein